MAILIEKMKMPKSCIECELMQRKTVIGANAWLCYCAVLKEFIFENSLDACNSRFDRCPLKEIKNG